MTQPLHIDAKYGRKHWKTLFAAMCELDLTPHNDYGNILKTIQSPALIVVADNDGVIPLEQTIEQLN